MKKEIMPFIHHMPKAELHVHLAGTLTPEQIMIFAQRNHLHIPFETLEDIKNAYRSFNDLESFIKLYNTVNKVLQTEEDFYDLAYAYLKKAAAEHVLHAEIFFEVQTHLPRGIQFATVINGLHKASMQAEHDVGITSSFILCFLRNLSQEEAFVILDMSLAYKDYIVGIGLAGQEKGYPPSAFADVFKKAKEAGYKLCAHAGEDVGPDYIWQAIRVVNVDRIDHGVQCIKDPTLIAYLRKTELPITVCPLSNKALGIVADLADHPLKQMCDAGLNVSINSDDPPFFGGMINANYQAAYEHIGLSKEQLIACARNSIRASFVSEKDKKQMLKKLEKNFTQKDA